MTCPLCHNRRSAELFRKDLNVVVRCLSCGLVRLDPQPDDATLETIYSEMYFIGSEGGDLKAQTNLLKRGTARLQLAEIKQYVGEQNTSEHLLRALEIGCGLGNFLLEARDAGLDIYGIDVSANAVTIANEILGENRARAVPPEELDIDEESQDIVVLADVIEHVRNPAQYMGKINRLIKPGGSVFIATPSLDSVSARLMGRYWVDYKTEHLFYFNKKTITRLLEQAGFTNIAISPGHKMLSLDYVIEHFVRYPVPIFTPIFKGLKAILPATLRRRAFRITASGINVVATVNR